MMTWIRTNVMKIVCFSWVFFYHVSGVKAALLAPGQIPGCSGTRNLQDNLSDLRAQVAANQKVTMTLIDFFWHISTVFVVRWISLHVRQW